MSERGFGWWWGEWNERGGEGRKDGRRGPCYRLGRKASFRKLPHRRQCIFFLSGCRPSRRCSHSHHIRRCVPTLPSHAGTLSHTEIYIQTATTDPPSPPPSSSPAYPATPSPTPTPHSHPSATPKPPHSLASPDWHFDSRHDSPVPRRSSPIPPVAIRFAPDRASRRIRRGP